MTIQRRSPIARSVRIIPALIRRTFCDRLDLLRRQLRVEEPLKTPAARRTVSFPPFLADELAAHLNSHPRRDGLVFTAPDGGPLQLRLFRRRFWYLAVRQSVGEPVRPHDLGTPTLPY